MSQPETVPGIPLAEAIGWVRAELAQAIEDGKDSPLAFRSGPVELEFQVAFSKQGGGDIGVRVWVLSLGAKGEVSSSETHSVKVSLTPVDREGKDRLIGDAGRQ